MFSSIVAVQLLLNVKLHNFWPFEKMKMSIMSDGYNLIYHFVGRAGHWELASFSINVPCVDDSIPNIN